MGEIHSALAIPADYKLGPAMAKLTLNHRAFVVALLDFGGINPARAAAMAGYGTPTSTANTMSAIGYRLAHDENIIAAIKEEADRRLRSGAIMAVKTLLEIADNASAKNSDRIKAAEMILNRSGLHVVTEQNITVTHKELSDEDTIKKIQLLADNLGVDPRKLLGNAGVILDAEFKVLDQNSIADML